MVDILKDVFDVDSLEIVPMSLNHYLKNQTLDNLVSQLTSSALSVVSAVVADGSYNTWFAAATDVAAITAAGWDASEHPRGKDGKFIKKGVGLPLGALSILKTYKSGGYIDDFTVKEQTEFIEGINQITREQWKNLKFVDQDHLKSAAEHAMDNNIAGAATAQMHLDDLTNDEELQAENDLFNPNTSLPDVPTSDANARLIGKALAQTEESWTQLPAEERQAMAKDLTSLFMAPSTSNELAEVASNALKHINDLSLKVAQKEVAKSSPVTVTKEEVVDLFGDDDNDAFVKSTYQPPAPVSKVKPPTPIKMTHAFIHGKHDVGTVAVAKNGAKLHWNGKTFDVYTPKGHHMGVPKSKVYGILQKESPNVEWATPGKQETASASLSSTKPVSNVVPGEKASYPIPGDATNLAKIFDSLKDYEPGELIGTWKYKKGDTLKSSFEYRKAKDGTNSIVVYEDPGFGSFQPIKKWKSFKDYEQKWTKVPAVQQLPSEMNVVPPKGKSTSSVSPFTILEDTGENGDGYAAPGLWGKYGAAGVMIKNVDANGVERFLLVQRGPMVSSNKGKWQLAGGALNSKETPEQGAAREIFEEIGAPQEYLGTMQHKGTHAVSVPIPGKDPWVYSNIAAEAPTMFDPKIDGTETGDAKWLTKEEINALAKNGDLHPALAKQLKSVFALYDTSDNAAPATTTPVVKADTPVDSAGPGGLKDLSGWKKVGSQKGSNTGGLFEAPDGTKYYVKKLKSDDHVRNEVLAASLYRAAGIDVPEVTKGSNSPLGSGDVVVSRFIDGATSSHAKLVGVSASPTFKAKVQQGFAVDAWLANWDVVGMTYDNVLDVNGKPVRIDVGGSLLYRAQGGKKPFPHDKVDELQSLLNSGKNPQSAAVFGGMSFGAQRESAKMLLNVTDDKIAQLVKDAGYTGTSAAAMMKVLRDRRNVILKHYDLDKQMSQGAKMGVVPDTSVNVPEPTVPSAPTSTPLMSPTPIPQKQGIELKWLDSQYDDTEDQKVFAISFAMTAKKSDVEKLSENQKAAISDILSEAMMEDELPDADNAFGKWSVITKDPLPVQLPVQYDLDSPVDKAFVTDMLAKYPNGAIIAYSDDLKKRLKISGGSVIMEAMGADGEWKFYAAPSNIDSIVNDPWTKWKIYPPAIGAPTAQPETLFPNPAPEVISPPAVPPPTAKLVDAPWSVKNHFYSTFKAEKVSPSWSGAKIYNSIQAAKAKMSGTASIANATDAELLELADYMLKTKNPGKYKGNPFTEKVTDWLKTPAGKKAALKAKSATPHTAPVKSTTVPSGMTTTNLGFSDPAPVGQKIPIPGAKAWVNSILDGVPEIDHIPDAEQQAIYKEWRKPQVSAKADPEVIWDAMKNVAKAYPNRSMAEIVAIADKIRAEHTKTSNTNEIFKRLQTWLGTPDGNDAAQFTLPFDPQKMLKHNFPTSHTLVPIATQPDLTFNEVMSMNSTQFKIATTTEAKSWWDIAGDITASQKADLKYYTSNAGYMAMNPVLRGLKPGTPALVKRIDNAQKGMKPSDRDLLLHRGTTLEQFGSAKSIDDVKKLVGHTVQDKAFMSASVGGKAAFSGQPVLMEIEAPKGTGMAYLKGFSNYAGENEMLLSAGLRFKILSAEKTGYQIVVRVRIVPPESE